MLSTRIPAKISHKFKLTNEGQVAKAVEEKLLQLTPSTEYDGDEEGN